MRFGLPLTLGVVLATGCTTPNPGAQLDGAVHDIPAQQEAGRPPGTLGGPCLPGDQCNPGLKCSNGICVPITDGGIWDIGPLPDGPPAPDTQPACNPTGYKTVKVVSDVTGDWTVVLEPQCTDKTVTIAAAKPKDAAAVFDYNSGGQQVAGFVVSRNTTYANPVQEATAAVQEFAQLLNGVLTIRAPGKQGTTLDNHPAVLGTALGYTHNQATNIAVIRMHVIAGLLATTVPNVGGLPPPFGTSTDKFVIRLATVLRKGNRTVFIGAVTDEAGDVDPAKLTSAIAEDLASATGLAMAGSTTKDICDSQTIATTPKNQVDIIWVMDESGSMDDKRAEIAAGAASLFNQLAQTGLDFRMGVTNVCSPTGAFSAAVGKFCSVIATNDNQHDGGPDRFLLSTEQAIFSACINNPPGFEGGLEYGMVNAREAVKRHLPRAPNDPTKIRNDAQVVVIVVTDEAPQSLKDQFSNPNLLKQCTLSATNQATVDAFAKPYIDFFSGVPDTQSKIEHFQVIGGVCNSTGTNCSFTPDVAYGYQEVAQQHNGQVYDVCQANLNASVTKILNGIVATATTVTLKNIPIAASLKVALDGVVLQRSNVTGFKHPAGTNTLLFPGAQLKQGSTVVASYKLW